jgi:phosphoribosyl 1,2-cyclic phosphate phosphodiesterase
LKITFLGTGPSLGVPVINCHCEVCSSKDLKDKRLRTSVIIEKEGVNILIDISPDFRQQVLVNQIYHIDALLITHEHRDHIAGLDDIRPFNFIQKSPIEVYTSARVKNCLGSSYNYIFEDDPYPGSPELHINIIDKRTFEIKGIDITPIDAVHYKHDQFELPVTGFRIGALTYLTDIKYISKKELSKAKGTKILVLNALRKEIHYSHLNLEEAIGIINKIKPEKAYLTHISHQMGKHNDIQSELPDNVSLAYDGLSIDIEE